MRHQHGLTDLGCFVTFGKTWQNISKFWRLEWLVELFHSWFPGEMIACPYFLHVYSRVHLPFLWEIPCFFHKPLQDLLDLLDSQGIQGVEGFLLWMVAKSCTRQGNSWPLWNAVNSGTIGIIMGLSQDKSPINWCRISQPSTVHQGFLPVSTCPFAPWTVPFKSWLILPIDAASNRFCSGQTLTLSLVFNPKPTFSGKTKVFSQDCSWNSPQTLPLPIQTQTVHNVLYQDDSEQDKPWLSSRQKTMDPNRHSSSKQAHPNQCQLQYSKSISLI